MSIIFAPDQPINALTVAELETLIAEIVRRVMREEIQRTIAPTPDNNVSLPEMFLATFGAWEDERSAHQIITEIYASRKVSPSLTSIS